MGGWVGGWVAGWLAGWLAGCMDGWMDGWLAGWMDGWMDAHALHSIQHHTQITFSLHPPTHPTPPHPSTHSLTQAACVGGTCVSCVCVCVCVCVWRGGQCGGSVADRSTKTDNGIQPVFMSVHIMGERDCTDGRTGGEGGTARTCMHVCMHAC